MSYICQACGNEQKKWLGKCPECLQWNSFVEEIRSGSQKHSSPSSNSASAKPITELTNLESEQRIHSYINEFDRVLGGGLVKGSVVLLAGEPGIGKSTLLISAAHNLAAHGAKTLYISAEESLAQVHLTAKRINALHDNFYLLSETQLSNALRETERINPNVLFIDSVQTFTASNVDSAPGTISQIREIASEVIHLAKNKGIATILVGHITKEGQIAGPRLLEHMVDTVLYFENTRSGHHRILRAHKNRFGSTNELGIFEMNQNGLREVGNPSASFLAERAHNKPGSVITASIEGNRPLLVEIQALCVDAHFGSPRRTALGIDTTRCSVIAAVLEKHLGFTLSRSDLFVNIAGGTNLNETASDLPLAIAIASSFKNRPVKSELVIFGELGLSGELRSVQRIEPRLEEASRLGFKHVLMPESAAFKERNYNGLNIMFARSIYEALELALPL